MKHWSGLALLGMALAGSAVSGPAAPSPQPGASDSHNAHAVPGWYLGVPVLLRAQDPPPDIDRKNLPAMRVYVHAPVSAAAGAAPTRQVPRPDGKVVTLPPHQDTLESLNAPDSPRLGVGYFVLRGPKGNDQNVRVQPQPEQSWPRSPLVSEIRIGPEWVKVNSHAVIEYGLRSGLLDLQFFDVGGMMYGQFMDPPTPALDALARLDWRATPPTAAPPIDWANDRDFKPGQSPP